MRFMMILMACLCLCAQSMSAKKTKVTIVGDKFYINGVVTFKGKTWRGTSIEGLLPNCRMANALFDDETDSTRYRWVYPDTKKWDANRNTNEFIAQMPVYRKKGLLAMTINLQGGSPQGYSKQQPWRNTALDSLGNLKPAYMKRLTKVLDKADKLGMVVILGVYYFGQEKYIKDEAAIKNGLRNVALWVLKKGYENVILEVDNECDFYKVHKILTPKRVHEAIAYAKSITLNGRRLLVSASNGGGRYPTPEMVRTADLILLHGNGIHNPLRIPKYVEEIRNIPGYTAKPIVFNEDDHFKFNEPVNNFVEATKAGASWGYFDYRKAGEPMSVGFQCVPVDWTLGTERKQQFFNLLEEWGR